MSAPVSSGPAAQGSRLKGPRWTRDEKRWLSAMITAGMPVETIAEKLERSVKAIVAMAGKLGFYGEDIA